MGSQSRSRFQRAQFDVTITENSSSSATINSLPELLLFNARNNGQVIFCAQAKIQPGLTRTFELTKVTFLELALSVEYCCTWITDNTKGIHQARVDSDGKVKKSEPIALFLESDLTLFIYITALLALNIPCLLLSTRLNSKAIGYLMKNGGCRTLIVSDRTRSSLDALDIGDGAEGDVSLINASKFESFLPDQGRKGDGGLVHLESCRQAVREDDINVVILHSSGTTGQPKLIPLTHRYILGYAGCHEFAPSMDMSQRGYNVSTLPLFHGFGVLAPCLALSVGMPVLFPPGDTIPNASLLVDLIRNKSGWVTSAMSVPTILEDITILPNFTSDVAPCLAKLDFLVVGGGGIKHTVGTKLHNHGVSLVNHFGATELGALAPIFLPDSSYDWKYLRLRRDMNVRLERIDSEPECSSLRKLIGFPFGWDRSFELQDRLEVNPLKPETEVAILGRNDDLIVLATGEKVLPFLLEQSLETHPLIKQAVVFGNGQFEVGVLVEPFQYQSLSEPDFLEIVWQEIIKANKLMDHHAQVSSQKLIIIKPEQKQIPLTDKGSVRRKDIHAVFKLEIDTVYTQLLHNGSDESSTVFDLANPKESIRELVLACLPDHVVPESMEDDTDFIYKGMDSLRITRLRRSIEKSLRDAGQQHDVPRDIIYSYPSIAGLTGALTGWLNGSISELDPINRMLDTTNEYTYNGSQVASQSHEVVVLVTGTTGNLGANLLQQLALSPKIDRIICMARQLLVRDGDSVQDALIERQKAACKDRGIILSPEEWLKIEMLAWTPGDEYLGLGSSDFHLLARRITHVFHGAWPMDFKLTLRSLEPHIKALRDLVELGRLSHYLNPTVKVRLLLASSIAVVGRFESDGMATLVPEMIMEDPHVPLPFGYAQAKWVCEKIMQSAHQHVAGISPVVLRIGQLSGSSTTGFWSQKEHFPALIKCSQIIGGLPNLQGSASWMPVDRAAAVAADILLSPELPGLVYHLENPVRRPWQDICTVLERELSLQPNSRLAFAIWLEKFSKTEDVSQDLMDFFQNHFLRMSGGALILDTKEARKVSHSLRSSGDVSHSTIQNYVKFWQSIGLLR